MLQNYDISWTCSGCYYQKSGSKISLKSTTTNVTNLQRDQTYNFSVSANTIFGRGERSTITATISRYFGQVQSLKQSFENYTVTLEWGQPKDVEAKDIKVSFAIVFLGRKVCVLSFCPKYKMLILVNNWKWRMIIAVNIPIEVIWKKKPEKIRASMGFEPVTSTNTGAMLYQLSYEATHCLILSY